MLLHCKKEDKQVAIPTDSYSPTSQRESHIWLCLEQQPKDSHHSVITHYPCPGLIVGSTSKTHEGTFHPVDLSDTGQMSYTIHYQITDEGSFKTVQHGIKQKQPEFRATNASGFRVHFGDEHRGSRMQYQLKTINAICIDGFSGKIYCSGFSLPFVHPLHCFMNVFHLYHCVCH